MWNLGMESDSKTAPLLWADPETDEWSWAPAPALQKSYMIQTASWADGPYILELGRNLNII